MRIGLAALALTLATPAVAEPKYVCWPKSTYVVGSSGALEPVNDSIWAGVKMTIDGSSGGVWVTLGKATDHWQFRVAQKGSRSNDLVLIGDRRLYTVRVRVWKHPITFLHTNVSEVVSGSCAKVN